MARILIVSCNKIRDVTCIACLKCFKAAEHKEGEFAKYDSVQIVGQSGCGDCPGLVMNKVNSVMENADYLSRDIDAIHIGSCVVKARTTAACPINLDGIKAKLEGKFGKPLVIGTHNY